MNGLCRDFLFQRFKDRKEPMIILIEQPLLYRTVIFRWRIERIQSDLRSADCLHQGSLKG